MSMMLFVLAKETSLGLQDWYTDRTILQLDF